MHNLEPDLEKKIFNYHLSRAQRTIENCFSIAASRFRVFRRPIIGSVETVVLVTKAVVALHNFLMKSLKKDGDYYYCPPGFADTENVGSSCSGSWRTEIQDCTGLISIASTVSHNYTKSVKEIRDAFKNYFNSPDGAVSWQWEYVKRTTNRFDEVH